MVMETVGNLAVFLWSWMPHHLPGLTTVIAFNSISEAVFLLSTQRTSCFYCHQATISLPGPATHQMLMSHDSVTHATSHPALFLYCQFYSKWFISLKETWADSGCATFIYTQYFSQWFKCFLSRRKFFILENIHHKRKTIKYALDIFSVSLSEVKYSVWMQENGWNGKVLQVMNSQCRQKLKYLYYTILHYHNTSHYASAAASGSDLHCWVNLVLKRWHHIRCYGNFPSFAEQKALLARCGFVISASLGKGATHLPAEDFIMLVGNN